MFFLKFWKATLLIVVKATALSLEICPKYVQILPSLQGENEFKWRVFATNTSC